MPKMTAAEWDDALYDKYCSEDHNWYYLYNTDEQSNCHEAVFDSSDGGKILIITVSFNTETRIIDSFSTVCENDYSESSHFRPNTVERYILVREQKEYLSYLSAHITDDPSVLIQSRERWQEAKCARQILKENEERKKEKERRTKEHEKQELRDLSSAKGLPYADLIRWISGQEVYVPEVTIQTAAAIKAKNFELVRAALEHLRTMEGDRNSQNWFEQDRYHSTWFIYTMSLVRVICNKCLDEDIPQLAGELQHIRDTVEEYKSHTSFNPLQYQLVNNPLVDIIECINKRIPV